MGGNATFGDLKADPIDLKQCNWEPIIFGLFRMLVKSGLWHPNTTTDEVASGSTSHLFDNYYDTMIHVKPVFGDFDFQIDKRKSDWFGHFLDQKMNNAGPQGVSEWKLIAYKETPMTFVTLWRINEQNVQVDFEKVDFDVTGREPTHWSRFAFSSPWIDMTHGIKGVAHKLVFRALTATSLDAYRIERKSGTFIVYTNYWAFSNRGLRQKLVQIAPSTEENLGGTYREIKSSEADYIQDPVTIAETLIGKRFYPGSYIEVVNAIAEMDYDARKAVFEGMTRLLFGSDAQTISSNRDEDALQKGRILRLMGERLDI